MKISQQYLKQIIKEEINIALSEDDQIEEKMSFLQGGLLAVTMALTAFFGNKGPDAVNDLKNKVAAYTDNGKNQKNKEEMEAIASKLFKVDTDMSRMAAAAIMRSVNAGLVDDDNRAKAGEYDQKYGASDKTP